jgi:Prohead core protein serine protease/Intein splicing domain
MNKQLLVDFISFEINRDVINEIANSGGPFVVKGVLQRANAKNQNGRVYPKPILEREAIKYTENFIKQRRALGELDHPECFSKSGEYLSIDGWKKLIDAKEGELVATLNVDTNTLEYNPIERVINESYKGKMFSIQGKNINTLVTPNHRFILKDRNNNFVEKTAQELFDISKTIKNSHLSIPIVADNWVGKNFETFTFPGVNMDGGDIENKNKQMLPLQVDAKAWFSFLGFYLAEGHCTNADNSGYGVFITQNEGVIADEFRKILNQLSSELKWNEYKKGNSGITFAVYDARIWTYLNKLGDKYSKFIPSEIKAASTDLLQNLYDWYLNGDGTSVGEYERTSLFSVSKTLIDDLYEIALKIGLTGIIKEQISNKDYLFAGHLIEIKNKLPLYRLWIKTSQAIHLDFRFIKIQEVDFDETVHCITVKNGNFYCRDNNHSFWTGNSSVVNLQNVSHNVTEIHWEGDDLVGTVEVLPTPSGNILKELFRSSINVGISSRGVGSVKRKMAEAADEVQDDFELIAFDFVSNPSTRGAFMMPSSTIQENIQNPITNKWDSVENIIREILGEIK